MTQSLFSMVCLNSGKVEKTGVPKVNHRPSASKMTNFLSLACVRPKLDLKTTRENGDFVTETSEH